MQNKYLEILQNSYLHLLIPLQVVVRIMGACSVPVKGTDLLPGRVVNNLSDIGRDLTAHAQQVAATVVAVDYRFPVVIADLLYTVPRVVTVTHAHCVCLGLIRKDIRADIPMIFLFFGRAPRSRSGRSTASIFCCAKGFIAFALTHETCSLVASIFPFFNTFFRNTYISWFNLLFSGAR